MSVLPLSVLDDYPKFPPVLDDFLLCIYHSNWNFLLNYPVSPRYGALAGGAGLSELWTVRMGEWTEGLGGSWSALCIWAPHFSWHRKPCLVDLSPHLQITLIAAAWSLRKTGNDAQGFIGRTCLNLAMGIQFVVSGSPSDSRFHTPNTWDF